MRGLRSTGALLVVLLGLCGYIYFVLSKKPEGGAEAPKDRVFAALEADKVDEITVKAESGDVTTLKKADGTWRMTSPVAVKADEMQASAVATNLSTLEITRIVDENPADLKDYGLDPPRVEIEFKASADQAYANTRRLFLGSKSPTGGDLFARRDAENRVFLVPAYTDPIFNRMTFDLRDKTLLAFDRDKVDRIEVSPGGSGATSIALAKAGDDWKLTKPAAALADYATVSSLISRLQTLAVKSIVTEQAAPSDLSKYGFDKPQATVLVAAGGAPVSLTIGAKTEAGDVYVREGSNPLVATADGALVQDLQKGADDYRRKEIFAFRVYSTDRLEFTRDGQTIVFEKVKGADQTPEKWRRASPTAGDPPAMEMDALLVKLETLRATSFVDSVAGTGLDKPSLTVYAKFEEGKKEDRVSFARTGSDVYAATPGQPGAVKVAASDFDDIAKALDAVSK